MERFLRTEILVGKENLNKIRKSRVAVFGLGAVGSYAVEALARAGVGTLHLFDFDEIKRSNINRQLYAFESTVGQSKASLASARVRDINPYCTVEATELFVVDDIDALLSAAKPDIVVDAIDSINPKVQLLAAAHTLGVPIVSSMGAALRTDPSCIRTGDLFATRSCPMAKQLRKRLRRRGIHEGVFCVYSKEERIPGTWKDDVEEEGPEYVRGRKRKTLGSLSTVPGIFGLLVAHYALERICGSLKKP